MDSFWCGVGIFLPDNDGQWDFADEFGVNVNGHDGPGLSAICEAKTKVCVPPGLKIPWQSRQRFVGRDGR